MKRGLATGLWLGGLGAGAGLMYLLDPDRGHARRIRLRDKAVHGGRVAERALTHTLINARNRTRGAVVETIDRLADLPVPDSLLVERVRAKMGHFVDNTHTIRVTAKDGVVHLEGRVRADQLDDLLEGVGDVRGVDRVENALEVMGVDETSMACNGTNLARKIGIPLAIGTLGAVGAVLFFRMREMQQMVETPATMPPPDESMPETYEVVEIWSGEPALTREAA